MPLRRKRLSTTSPRGTVRFGELFDEHVLDGQSRAVRKQKLVSRLNVCFGGRIANRKRGSPAEKRDDLCPVKL
jgi:hypothetical protein